MLSNWRQGLGRKLLFPKGYQFPKEKSVATTDADCLVPVNWLERINDKFQSEQVNMVVGLVSIDSEKNIFSRLQSIEFASVIGTGIGTLGLGFPTMCNGANLSFRKKTFLAVNGYEGNEHVASGDDEFLMRKVNATFPNSIEALDSDSIVRTYPQPAASDFIQQRFRWASKWKVNSSFISKALAILIFLVQLSWISSLVLSFYYPGAVRILSCFPINLSNT
ncbi:MAG: glycosyltransferase family 2 protein, partial [Cyclobacteriaceae bacterium]